MWFEPLRGERSWNTCVRVNGRPTNWRERVGDWLRAAAMACDGRWSLAVELKSTERLSIADQKEVFRAGFDTWTRQLEVVTHHACVEQMLKAQRPDLQEQPEALKP